MPLVIEKHVLGQLENNTYCLIDPQSAQAVIIDPSFGAETLVTKLKRRHMSLEAIWLTHAHFDHIAGVRGVQTATRLPLPVALHPLDLALWQDAGGARHFGFNFNPGDPPALELTHGQILKVGEHAVEVRHTRGHSPGHVIFYAESAGAAFVGDLVFRFGIGRTDLPGGNMSALLESIHNQVLSLPARTRLLPGHGEETTVAAEADGNPYLR